MNAKKLIRVFDNGGKSWDRYTIVIYESDHGIIGGNASVYGMSTNATSPDGFNQYCGTLAECTAVIDALNGHGDSKIGKEIELTDLPQTVKEGIGYRLS